MIRAICPGLARQHSSAEGIKVVPPSQIKASFPVLKNPANRHRAVGFTPKQFHYAFTNTLSEEKSLPAYERYHVPAPGSCVWGGVLANFTPGHQDTYVDFKNDDRAPLLFIAGGEDNIMPPSVNESNVHHHRKSSAVTEYKEFAGCSHFTVGQDGWEEVADYALNWAKEHAMIAAGERTQSRPGLGRTGRGGGGGGAPPPPPPTPPPPPPGG
jgi:pimeloyl-ACP methyl ester carboxylesterase